MNIALFADINDNHNQKWIDELVKGNNVIIITLANNSVKDKKYVDDKKLNVFALLPEVYSFMSVAKFNRARQEVNFILKKYNIEIIHSIYSSPYSLWADLFQKNNHIITTYGSDVLIEYQKIWKAPSTLKQLFSFYYLRKKTEKAFNNATFITSTSISQQKVIKQFVSDKNKLIIIRTGVDCDLFLDLINSSNCKSEDDFVVLSNRAMRPLYNIDKIVDAFLIFIKDKPIEKIKLILLDYNTDKNYLKSINHKIEQAQLQNNILIYKDLNLKELTAFYRKSSVVVMIPDSDGTPVSGVEAFLSRIPLVIGNLKYDEDLFNNETCWSIEENSAVVLSKKLEELYRLKKDELDKKTENAFNIAITSANLSVELQKLRKCYEQVLIKNA